MPRSVSDRRRAIRLGVVTLAGATATLAAAPGAHAAFTTGKCLGDALTARGASFANSAHTQVWAPTGFPAFCADVGSNPAITYSSTGSGSGRRVMGERTNGAPEGDNTTGAKSRSEVPRIGMTEEPPSTTGQAQINAGTDSTGDEGLMRLLPAALGSVAVVVNVPNWGPNAGEVCSLYKQADGSALTADQQKSVSSYAADDTTFRRLQLTRAQVETIFNGGDDMDTWGELVPWINDGNGTAAEANDTWCSTHPIVRVRRLDDGGTTFVLKDYLNQLNGGRGWSTTYVTPDTRTWPNHSRNIASFDWNNDGDTADAIPSCAAQFAPFSYSACNESGTAGGIALLQTTEVAAPGGNGNDDLVNKVNDLDGAIGYGDLSTARQQRAFAFERQSGVDDRYWVKVQTKSNASTFADPQSAPEGFRTGGARGSNCTLAQLRNVPTGDDPTVASWATVSATDSANGYGICSLTYAIVFDDYSGPYSAQSDQAAEERKARTVRDYMESIVTSGQNGLGAFDYSALPLAVQQLALSGVQKIGWQKTAGTGGGGGQNPDPTPTPTPTPAPGAGGGPVVTPPPVTPPSNVFTIPSARVKSGNIVLSIQIPGGGAVRAIARARPGGRLTTIASGASSRASGGTLTLTLKPNSKALRELKKRGTLKVTIAVTFTPTGGTERTQTAKVTLKAKKAKKKRK